MGLTTFEQEELNALLAEQERRNKKTMPGYIGQRQKGMERAATRIESKGSKSVAQAVQDVTNASGWGKVLPTLGLIGLPISRFNSGIANASLSLQNGDIENAWEAATDGFMGRKQVEIGDVYRSAGVPELASATIGLVTEMLPMFGAGTNLLKQSRFFGGLKKLRTDKLLIKAGETLTKAMDAGIQKIRQMLSNAYAPINHLPVDGLKTIKALDDLPPRYVKLLEKELGKTIDDIMQSGTVEDLHRITSTVGKIKSAAFGKAIKGAKETLDDEKIVTAYAKLKSVLGETLVENKVPKKVVDALDNANESYVKISNSVEQLKNLTVDKIKKTPTKIGKMAEAIQDRSDLTTRDSINQLLIAGKEANKNIKKTVNYLQEYNNLITTQGIAGKVLNYAVLGGVAGSIGSRSVRNVGGGDD